jgi:hypothetical protein
MPYDVLISKLNVITKYAEADQCGDEMTWGMEEMEEVIADWLIE